MEDLVKCECGCEVFIQLKPICIGEGNFRVWRTAEVIQAEATTIPVVECIQCGRYKLPACTFSGRNILDPEVQLYGKLYAAVESHNENIAKGGSDVEASGPGTPVPDDVPRRGRRKA